MHRLQHRLCRVFSNDFGNNWHSAREFPAWKAINRSSFVSLVLLATVTAQSGCAKSDGHQSPEAVFEAARVSLEKKDYDDFCECLTPDSKDVMAGGMAMMGMMMKAFASFGAVGGEDATQRAAASTTAIDDVLNKHGLSQERIVQLQNATGDKPADPLLVMKQLVAPIEDKPAFIGDMFAAMETLGGDKAGQVTNALTGTLTDLKINGDQATGTMVIASEEDEQRKPIAFQRTEAGWLIDLPLNAEGQE